MLLTVSAYYVKLLYYCYDFRRNTIDLIMAGNGDKMSLLYWENPVVTGKKVTL